MKEIFTSIILALLFINVSFSQAPFVTTWQVADTNIKFPGIGDYQIDWAEVGNPWNSGTKMSSGYPTTYVDFPSPGTYEISVTGNLEQMQFQNISTSEREEFKSIDAWGDIAWVSMENAFEGCSHMEYNASDAPDLSNITSLSYMFANCELLNGNLNNWNTSTITDMSYMFLGTDVFNGAIDQWDVSNVMNMSNMFNRAGMFNQPIGFWDVSSVTDMSYMFGSAFEFNQPLGFWNTAQVTNMSNMFRASITFNQFIGNWDVSNVTDFSQMFNACSLYNQDMLNWNVSSGADFSYMFYDCTNFNGDISSWNPSSATTFHHMFHSAINFNQNINNWNVSSVTDFSYMFRFADLFDQPLNLWNTSSATTMKNMFEYALNFNQDINSWNVSNVGDMSNMLEGAYVFNQSLNAWDVSSVTTMSYMFFGAREFNGDITTWNVSNVTDMSNLFHFALMFDQDIGAWDVSNVTDMTNMFQEAYTFNQDISTWDVSNVTLMTGMFEKTKQFNQDISTWSISNVTSLSAMFRDAEAFNQDISAWDVSNVMYMSSIFYGTWVFNQDLSNWNTASLESMAYILYEAQAFDQSLAAWDISNVTNINYAFYYSNLSINNYDNTIISWANQNVNNNLTLRANGLNYCNSETARQSLENDHNWEFIGDSKDCPPFVTTWKTDNLGATNDNQILLPATGTSIYDISWTNVNSPWINGTFTGSGATVFTFPSPGTYQLTIDGEYGGLDFYNNSGDRLKILSVDEWGGVTWTDFTAAFYRCENLNITATDAPNLVAVTNLFGLFEECTSLNADLSHWDVSTITNMSRMFKNASSFNQDLGNWNVSNVTNMSSMLDQTSLSLENYDNTIIGWSSQPVQPNITLGSSGLEYCEAKPERQAMINTSNWTFSGDTYACPFTDIYVDHTATGTNDGTSWTNAFTDLQSALALGQDHHIHIAKGTYKPTSGLVRGIAFEIGHRVHLYGGYPNGGGTRNVSTNLTNLSGEIDDIAGFTGNSYHVVKVADVFDVVLDGIIVRDGAAIDPASFGRARGGGLYLKNTTITLNDVEVKWNKAIYGAGLFATLSPEVRIINSEFKKNTADYGSALYHSNETNMFIEHSKIVDNTSLNRCAIEINNSLYTKIENSIIADNASTNANAIAFIATNRDQSCDITNTTIVGESKNKNLITIQIGYNDQMDLTMNNSIVAHQTASFDKNVKAFNNGVLNFNHNHCYFQGTTVIGNGTNTLFSDMDGGLQLNSDYSVADCSPVVDAGNNSLGVGATDYFGNPRYYNTIDIGAYEAQAVCKTFAKENTREEEGSCSIYPNPTNGRVYVETTLENPSIIITDMLGRELISTQEMEINIHHLPKGVYLVYFFENGNNMGVSKLVKE